MENKKIKMTPAPVAILALLALGGSAYYANALTNESSGDDMVVSQHFAPNDLNEGGAEDIGSLPLPEAKKRLNYLIAQTGDFINTINAMQRLTLKIAPVETGISGQSAEALQYEPVFVPFTTAEIARELAAIKDKPIHFYQEIYSNGSIIKLLTEPLDGIWKRAQTPEDNQVQHYAINRVYFRDGTEQTFAEAGDKTGQDNAAGSLALDQMKLSVNKPADNLTVAVAYSSYPRAKKIVLDKDHPKVAFDHGESYQLTAIQGKSASLIIAAPKDASYVVQGYAAPTDKPLRNVGNNSSSLPSEQDRANLNGYYQELLAIERDFSQFKTSGSIQDRLLAFAKSLPVKPDAVKNVRAEYDFEAMPQRIEITVLDPLETHSTELVMTNRTPPQDRYIAYDAKTEAAGFIDKNGKWLIKPTFIGADYTEAKGVYRMVVQHKPLAEDMSESIVKYYYFAPGTNRLTPFTFDIIETKINDDLLLVERETNGPYGVYDLKQHKFTVPMNFVNPKISGDVLVARVGDKTYESADTYGAYTLSGQQLLPPKYNMVELKDNYLYATAPKTEIRDVFDLKGKKINPPQTSAIGTYVDDQPLLVIHTGSKKYAFIDPQGNVLPFVLPYEQVEPFSNGMAVVNKEGKYGAIDLSGKLSIPVEYESIAPFQKNLAAAQPADFDGLVLIDRNNTQVKKLGHYSQYQAGANSNDARYTVFDPQKEGYTLVYDADGKVVDSFKNQ